MYKYGVVILNYNSACDTAAAVQSVRECASDSYFIQIVDNNSSDKNTRNILNTLICSTVDVKYLDTNKGYAYGNNVGFKLIKGQIEYLVIMNPDVKLVKKNCIEQLISEIENEPTEVVGAQPLVWTQSVDKKKEYQVNVRKVYSTFDCLIESCFVLRKLFSHSIDKVVYRVEMPYKTPFMFQVPSGAFFLIDANTFDNIDGFDTNTFLYFEEVIIGKKLESLGKKFVFRPDIYVIHEQGKSTASTSKRVNQISYDYETDSIAYYMKTYCGASKTIVHIYRKIRNFDYRIRKLKYKYDDYILTTNKT